MEIEIRNLRKVYGNGTVALANCNLHIGAGLYGLLGPNGAGKTTLLRILATILAPTSGDVTILGRDLLKERYAIRSTLGYLPQEFGVYPNLSVSEYLDYMGLLSGMGGADRSRAVRKALGMVNLESKARSRAKDLSGGMKRRLGIAQAILHDPKVLIVDEPTAGLDPEERVRFRNLLAELAESRVVLLSTHIVDDISSTCPQLAVLCGGAILYAGAPQDMLEKARGMIWTARIRLEEQSLLRSKWPIISSKHMNDQIEVRLLSAVKPLPQALSVNPTLEDAYLVLMGGAQI